MISKIESSSNEKFKFWLSLTKAKGINEHQACLLTGKKLIQEYLSQNKDKVLASLSNETTADLPNLFVLSRDLLQKLSPNATAEDILVVPIQNMKSWNTEQEIPKNSIFIPIGDPANLGALLRSAYAFGCENIILLQEAAHPFLPKAIKASSGAVLSLSLLKGPSISELESIAPKILALDMHGTSINEVSLDGPILIGEEGLGVPDFSWQKVSIPIQPGMESLNATVAASILLHERFKITK